MTKEAKIGMLTGLGVIVAIGVLLSEYLGDRNTGPTAVPTATGKMATLPVGQEYRQQVMSPVNVPAMTPAGGGERTQLPGGGMVASPIATGPAGGGAVPALYAVEPAGTLAGPHVSGPVSPVPAGPTLMDGRSGGGPPILTLEQTVPVLLTPRPTTLQTPPKPVLQEYTIQPGDNLAKIAKKFYSSSKNSDVTRIVTANAGMLKDASSPLIAGKKLMIPVLATAAPAAPAIAPRPIDPGVVNLPGGQAGLGGVPIPGVVQPPVHANAHPTPPVVDPLIHPQPTPPAPADKSYTVQSGDTLEKIARKLAPGKINETMTKLVSLNGIKDASKLKVGQVLKVPA